MVYPKLRNVNKIIPPYTMNCFPKEFIRLLAEEIVYLLATKETMSLEGEEWEQIFAHCTQAEWKPSNVGLDDVVLGNCCWSAKTVKSSKNDIGTQTEVRLISGRNSPTYSYGEDNIRSADPDYIGKLVLGIWNERVSGIRQRFKFARTVVLVKGKDYSEFLIFETETVRYDPECYYFKWNENDNLVGFEKDSECHVFTWQPHGSQFTIIEEIPETRTYLKIRKPSKLNKQNVLKAVGFAEDWYTILPADTETK